MRQVLNVLTAIDGDIGSGNEGRFV